MLAELGLESLEQLYAHLPEEVLLKEPLKLEPGKSEYEIAGYFRRLAERNLAGRACFLGAGAYRHYRPVLVDALVSRGEFLTAYTPYQAEISQGTLMTIFEFQTMLCQLTGMDAANASVYDGSTAVPEAVQMARRITRRERVVVADTVHPEYRAVLETYARHQGLEIARAGYAADTGMADLEAIERQTDEKTAAVLIQSPNFFGVVEDAKRAAEIAHAKGALLIVVFSEAVAYGVLEPPREADIVAGELQSFAIAPSYGGPYAGVIATRQKYVRQLPGRLVGKTKDIEGREAYCLTLTTREQHIRREKATSNICTNQALVALMATIFMTVYGKRGLRELAEQNLAKAHYLAGKVPQKFFGPFFNEFVAHSPLRKPEEVNARLLERGIVGGLPLGRFYPELEDCLLLCATEMARREEMDAVAEAILGR